MKFRIGFALHSKKAERYLTSKLLELADKKDLEIVKIDRTVPIDAQGPFDLIVQKCNSDQEWEHELSEYSKMHPEVRMVDPIDKTKALRNRVTMLTIIHQLPNRLVCVVNDVKVFTPRQIEIHPSISSESVLKDLDSNEMEFPLLIKPKLTVGYGCHMLGFIKDVQGLEKALNGENNMTPPFILQQFLPHNSVIYKIYVVGDNVICTARPSLVKSMCVEPFQLLPRISSRVCKLDKDYFRPPEFMIKCLAKTIQARLELKLFNFDLLKLEGAEDAYCVVDINYFPGIDKIQNFEKLFIDFLSSALSPCNEA